MPTATQSNLDFSNTELAFKAKSDRQLTKAYWLFKAIGIPWLNAIGPKMLMLALNMRLPVKGLVKNTLFELFCGGETLAETGETSKYLFQYNVRTILDYSVEGEKNEAGFDETRDEIIKAFQHAAAYPEVAFCACKVTGVGDFDILAKKQTDQPLSGAEAASFQRTYDRLDAICRAAVEAKTPVFIDAEESWIQDTIDAMAEEMMARYNQDNAWVSTTVQLYRHDRLAYLADLIERSKAAGYQLGVKVVRGAYLEKENARAEEQGYATPMQANKAATDHDYNDALRLCMKNIPHVHICAGTHNEASSRLLAELMDEHGIEPGHTNVLFSQLLGMSDNISFNLGHGGYNTAKYLPYGPVKAVMPYLIRRAQENTSVAGQAGRELQLLSKERKRRK
ncbi:MAG: proline dehydrogenase family protein [Bacteroidia bacterium]